MIFSTKYLNVDFKKEIKKWINFHLDSMNKFGFWSKTGRTHLQFQNGYHQYEIFDYLSIQSPKLFNAVELIKSMADNRGQFAPYYGGSGCYDYDAVSIITNLHRKISSDEKKLIIKTGNTILSEQNSDGGFSESQWIRPRSVITISNGIRHVLNAKGSSKIERLRYFIALNRKSNSLMHTHWTKKSRKWSESNIWDTWFRIMTIARIDIALNKKNLSRWKFIKFPGIGHYN